MSKILAIDLGDKRIGIAVSDQSRLIASPLQTVTRKNTKIDVARITSVAKAQEATEIVIGLPRNMDNTEGPQALKARAFGKQLGRASGLPIHFEDERLSTFSAIENLVARGVKTGANRELVDMEAAAIILQSFLDRQENRRG